MMGSFWTLIMVYINRAFTQPHFQLNLKINKYKLKILAINLHNCPLGPENKNFVLKCKCKNEF